MIENIFYYLKSNEFKPIEVNLPYLNVLQKEMEGFYYIINLVNLDRSEELEKNTYENILRQIKEKFSLRSENDIKILTIILTSNLQKAKLLIDDNELFWIVDTKKIQLIIYENQPIDFLSIRKGIEKILERKKYVIETKIEDLREEYNVSKNTVSVIVRFLTSITFVIILLNILVFIGINTGVFYPNPELVLSTATLDWEKIFFNGQWWRLLTYMFIHFNISHIFNNMILLMVLGHSLESYLGKLKFTSLYVLTGLGAGLVSTSMNLINTEYVRTGGASAAIYGVIGAIAYIVFIKKDSRIKISGNRMMLFLFLIIYNSFNGIGVDNVGHMAGLIIGFLICAIFLILKGNKKGIK